MTVPKKYKFSLNKKRLSKEADNAGEVNWKQIIIFITTPLDYQ